MMAGWTILSLVLSAALGALGGIVVAGQIAWRATRANARYLAGTQIRSVLAEYRRTIEYTEAQLPHRGNYPADYVDLASQYQLVRDVLSPAGTLSKRRRTKLESGLVDLVGKTTFNGAIRTVGVRPDAIDEDWEERQRQQFIAVNHPETGDQSAFLRRLVHDHRDVEVRQQAVKRISQLEHVVRRG